MLNNIDLEILYKIMLDFEIPSKIVRMKNLTMDNMESQANITTDSSLKQGDDFVSTLFNIALEFVLPKIPIDTKEILLAKSIPVGSTTR